MSPYTVAFPSCPFIRYEAEISLQNLLTTAIFFIPLFPSQILQYHILGAPISGFSVHPTAEVRTTGSISVGTLSKNQAALTLSTIDNTVRVQGSTNVALVTVANIRAGASIIHIIDAVLVPTLPEATFPTIVAAAEAYNLTTLVQVLSMTPLLATVIDATTAVTVFAPTNEVGDSFTVGDSFIV